MKSRGKPRSFYGGLLAPVAAEEESRLLGANMSLLFYSSLCERRKESKRHRDSGDTCQEKGPTPVFDS